MCVCETGAVWGLPQRPAYSVPILYREYPDSHVLLFENGSSVLIFWSYAPMPKLDVCLSVHRCICVEKKNQLDATEWFIALITYSNVSGPLCPSSGARDYTMLLRPMLCYALAAGCRGSGAGQQGVRPGWGILLDCSRTKSLILYKCNKSFSGI